MYEAAIILIFLGIVVCFSIYLRLRKKGMEYLPDEEPVPDEIVPVKMGKHTIWLRNCEIDNFNAQPRKMRLYIAKEFERKVRKGILVAVKEHGEIIGFVTAKEFREKTQ